MEETAYVGRQVVLPGRKEPCQAVVVVGGGRILRVLPDTSDTSALHCKNVVQCGDLVLMPGLVDSHVHVNEPGRTCWEGYNTATRAAAAGGITTIVDMPLNSIPPTTSVDAWQEKMSVAAGQLWVDVGYWGGVVPGNTSELWRMVQGGICGFKCFLIESGVDEFPCVSIQQAEEALNTLAGTRSILLFHAECDVGQTITDQDPPESYDTFLKSRPPQMEVIAIDHIIQLCERTKVRCHIVHLSASEALDKIRAAQGRGVPLSVETCHHYLTLDAHLIPDSATQYKCCPPIRDHTNRERLWAGVRDGTIQQVVSDHSPCTLDLKQPGKLDFMQAWGGISSLQFGLSLFWTEAVSRGFTVADVARLLSTTPAHQASLSHRKGAIAPGCDADFVIWDPSQAFPVTVDMILHKNKITPYLGKTLRGKVHKTVLRGHVIYESGSFTGEQPRGQHLFASTSSFTTEAKL